VIEESSENSFKEKQIGKSSQSEGQAKAAGCYLIVCGLFIACLGGFFTVLMGKSFLRAKEMDNWIATPCVILLSEREEKKEGPDIPKEYRLWDSLWLQFQRRGLHKRVL